MLDLEQHLDRKPANLSGGQRQRVAMGRAIVRDPAAFLMDEPLSNLDAKLRVQMRTEVARLQQRLGTTTVYVTHDQTEAMTLGDRVAVMRAGVLQQVGSPRSSTTNPANLFVAGFIGSPAMNFMPATIEGDTREAADRARCSCPQERGRLGAGGGPADRRHPAGALRGRSARWATSAASGATFKAKIDVVESMGSELYAYFTIESEAVRVAASCRSWPRTPAAARCPAGPRRGSWRGSTPRATRSEGQETELWLDT